MHKSESIQENEIHKTVCDFGTQTVPQIPARKPDLVLTK